MKKFFPSPPPAKELVRRAGFPSPQKGRGVDEGVFSMQNLPKRWSHKGKPVVFCESG